MPRCIKQMNVESMVKCAFEVVDSSSIHYVFLTLRPSTTIKNPILTSYKEFSIRM